MLFLLLIGLSALVGIVVGGIFTSVELGIAAAVVFFIIAFKPFSITWAVFNVIDYVQDENERRQEKTREVYRDELEVFRKIEKKGPAGQDNRQIHYHVHDIGGVPWQKGK